MRVAIIGAGISGKAAAKYWLAKGSDVTVHDRLVDVKLPSGVKTVLGPNYLANLNSYDLVVRSPGVRPRELAVTVPVTTGVREFFQRCPARIIGITGTKGKTTTAGLLARMLEEAGKRVWLGADGRSPLDFLGRVKASDLVVLELSSFQLMDLDVSPHIAVCLAIEPERMNWHGSVREYIAAKGNLFWHQQPGDIAVYNGRNDFSMQIAQLSQGRKVSYMETPGARMADGRIKLGGTVICEADEVKAMESSYVENVCAAATAAAEILGDKLEPVRRAVLEFGAAGSHGV
jgi:UDP-N-acetylmuramoylalanine--D-glutamate ligase